MLKRTPILLNRCPFLLCRGAALNWVRWPSAGFRSADPPCGCTGRSGHSPAPDISPAHRQVQRKYRASFPCPCCTLKFLVRIRQNFVPGVSDCSIALDIGIDQPMQVSIVLFQVSIGLVAGKHCRKHKRGMVQKIILLPN